jgi:hypothetical protein
LSRSFSITWQEDLDRLVAVVALVLGAVEVVGLVDEQDAAECTLEDLLGLRRGVSDVLPDLRLLDVAEAGEDLCHAQCHSRLSGTGVAGEAHVQGRPLRGEPDLAPQRVDDEQGGDLADAHLDRLERHELAVQALEHVGDFGVAQRGADVERYVAVALGRGCECARLHHPVPRPLSSGEAGRAP